MSDIVIREATSADDDKVTAVLNSAFGDEGAVIDEVVKKADGDKTAAPYLSLIAEDMQGNAIGHVLFTAAKIDRVQGVSVSLLAPLAVVAEHQKNGVGGKLINEGLAILKKQGVDVVFVLGHPGYYPKYGFVPAGAKGFTNEYWHPSHQDAWMMQVIDDDVTIEDVPGTVIAADMWNKEEYWRE